MSCSGGLDVVCWQCGMSKGDAVTAGPLLSCVLWTPPSPSSGKITFLWGGGNGGSRTGGGRKQSGLLLTLQLRQR